ncbi:hypothetical protein [Synechococcus sp. UW105]|uniref:hypothetical protein n=1 Tax=Synechococcus sp. UW105 TaxID=337067 RepID=UPI000E0ED285|nr:hypothetical protein [Synechococcus sp. UW105]
MQIRSLSPGSKKGVKALTTTLISILILLVGALVVQPRVGQRRLFIDDRDVLTPVEVAALPSGTLAVVLDRRMGQSEASFYYRLLRLVLERSGQPFALGFSTEVLPQDEVVNALASEQFQGSLNPTGVTVGAYGAGTALNRRLLPVMIPLTGGLLGVRAGWTHRNNLALLAEVKDLPDLRRLVLIQGLGWSDVEIFDAAGLRTYTTSPHDLLRLVDNQRVQLFPRGIAELERESVVVRRHAKDTQLDHHLLITYPFAGFFYVSRANPALATAIEVGFKQAIADGSYQQLLEEVLFTPWLRNRLNLSERRVIHLRNPDAAQALAGVDPAHWIVPWRSLEASRLTQGSQLCVYQRLRKLC